MATFPTHVVSRSLLNRETDARFWAQTHYRVGQPLDTSDPTDRAMAKVWHDIYLKVAAEDRAGHLRVTFNDPDVVALLSDARTASDAARAHLAAAQATPDPDTADDHVRAAADAHATSTQAARDAAARQPPTVSPIVVQAAAQEAARATGSPPPPPDVSRLPSDHPAIASPAARPRLPIQAILGSLSADLPSPHARALADRPPASPARDPLAPAQASAAPAVSAAVHEAHGRPRPGRPGRAPGPIGTTPPRTLADLRGGAQQSAAHASGSFVGVSLSPAGEWVASTFPDRDAAAAWYGDFADHPDAYRYAAYYDRTDGTSWPGPVEETLGSGKEIPVRVEVRPVSSAPGGSTPPGPAGPGRPSESMVPLLIGGLALGGLIALAAGGAGRTGGGRMPEPRKARA